MSEEWYSFDIAGDWQIHLVPKSFVDVRAAIEASYVIESPPLPRIERCADGVNYELITTRQSPVNLYGDDIDALATLAGHPLKIWEPKQRGEWMEIYSDGGWRGIVESDGSKPSVAVSLPLAIWRYTRSSK